MPKNKQQHDKQCFFPDTISLLWSMVVIDALACGDVNAAGTHGVYFYGAAIEMAVTRFVGSQLQIIAKFRSLFLFLNNLSSAHFLFALPTASRMKLARIFMTMAPQKKYVLIITMTCPPLNKIMSSKLAFPLSTIHSAVIGCILDENIHGRQSG